MGEEAVSSGCEARGEATEQIGGKDNNEEKSSEGDDEIVLIGGKPLLILLRKVNLKMGWIWNLTGWM